MDPLLFSASTPGVDLDAEARVATAALRAVISMGLRRMAEDEGKTAEESFAFAYSYLASSLIDLYPNGSTAFEDIITTARRLGLTVIPELNVKAVIQ